MSEQSSTQADQYAVVGNPIAHSKSPQIHALFAEQTRQHLQYRAILIEPGCFVDAVERFRRRGGRGLNVTLPFKTDAWAYAGQRSERAKRAGAVNTLHFRDDGTIFGDNTDGPGLVRDLTVNHDIRLQQRRILLLGAGGAARGVLSSLLAERPAQLMIANRTVAKAVELADLFADLGDVAACGFDELAETDGFDIIINATAAGLSDAVPPLPDTVLVAGGSCYDMVYADEATAFVRWAHAHAAGKALDGLGMLVEQAAESFAIWRGIRPETTSVITQLKVRQLKTQKTDSDQ
jgi:shikimate dehydrogenase